MARAGYRIFDADTHIIKPAEPIEECLTMADRAKLAALGPLVERAPARAGRCESQRAQSRSQNGPHARERGHQRSRAIAAQAAPLA